MAIEWRCTHGGPPSHHDPCRGCRVCHRVSIQRQFAALLPTPPTAHPATLDNTDRLTCEWRPPRLPCFQQGTLEAKPAPFLFLQVPKGFEATNQADSPVHQSTSPPVHQSTSSPWPSANGGISEVHAPRRRDMAHVVVDLTEDEVVVTNSASVPAVFQNVPGRNANSTSLWPPRAQPANPHDLFNPPRNPKLPPTAGDVSGSPLTASSRPSVKNEAPSPSRVTKFSIRLGDRSPVVRDPHPLHLSLKKPSPQPAATAPPPQPSSPRSLAVVQRPSAPVQPPSEPVQPPPADVQQPPELQTPKKGNWTVDKIAGKLGGFVEHVTKDHARLLEFLLEEAEARAPQPRYLTEFDDFADMKSIATDQGADSASDPDLMNFRFKVSLSSPAPPLSPWCAPPMVTQHR